MSNTDLYDSYYTYLKIDPLYRIHTRLYKIYDLNLLQITNSIELSKLNLSGYGILFSGFVGLFAYLFTVLSYI